MFDNYVFIEGTCKNYEENGKVAGFELQTLITYYRGIPLSMVYDLAVAVDGIQVPTESIVISVDQENWFTLKEAETVTSVTYKWEYGEPLYIRVKVDGGLRKGEHDVKLNIAVFPAYYPLPAGGERTRRVVIE